MQSHPLMSWESTQCHSASHSLQVMIPSQFNLKNQVLVKFWIEALRKLKLEALEETLKWNKKGSTKNWLNHLEASTYCQSSEPESRLRHQLAIEGNAAQKPIFGTVVGVQKDLNAINGVENMTSFQPFTLGFLWDPCCSICNTLKAWLCSVSFDCHEQAYMAQGQNKKENIFCCEAVHEHH